MAAQDWDLVYPVTPTFRDVLPDNPFYLYIETAYFHGTISGYDDKTFRWQNNATHGQIARVVHSARTGPFRD